MAVGLFSGWFLLTLAAVLGVVYWINLRLNLRWRTALFLRAGLVLVLLISLFLSASGTNQAGGIFREVMIVDQSDSLPEQTRNDLRQSALNWIDGGPNRVLLAFGATSEIVLQEPWPEVISRASHLQEALDQAAFLLADQPGRIILVSDGLVGSGFEVNEKAAELAEQGQRIDVIPEIPAAYENDLYTGELIAPSGVWEQMAFGVVLPVYAPVPGEAVVGVKINGLEQRSIAVDLVPGENFVSLALQSGRTGIMTVEAQVSWAGDGRFENNQSFGAIEVFSAPRVMLVTRDVGAVSVFRRGLESAGLQVDLWAPGDIPVAVGDMGAYQVILVHNILANDFSYEQMLALKGFVAQQGRGLIFLGGRSSYTLGGYQGTTLDSILPVSLVTPDRAERAPVTFVMVLDRSASMAVDDDSLVAPIDLTKEAAIRTIESMRPEDYLGILSFSGRVNWDLEIRQLGSGIDQRLAQDAVNEIQAAGGTFMYLALEEAITQLAAVRPTETLHILLMSDGNSSDGSVEEFQSLARLALRQNITISTIALGSEVDPENLELITREGEGRFYQVLDAVNLPNVMISESRAVQSENVQEGVTNLVLGEGNHPILSGFSQEQLPKLSGYNALTSKRDQGAEDILVSASFNDPILSAWQVGLGRVAAWMGDLGEEWAQDWRGWDRQSDFWVQVIRYALPDPGLQPTQAGVEVTDTGIEVLFNAQSFSGVPVNFADPEFSYLDGGGLVHSRSMRQTGPGEYSVSLPIQEIGAFRGVIAYQDGDQKVELAAPFIIPYPEEWQPGDAEQGRENLVRWAEITGGEELSGFDALESDLQTGGRPGQSKLVILILGMLVVFWPVEIAIRRWKMPWR